MHFLCWCRQTRQDQSLALHSGKCQSHGCSIARWEESTFPTARNGTRALLCVYIKKLSRKRCRSQCIVNVFLYLLKAINSSDSSSTELHNAEMETQYYKKQVCIDSIPLVADLQRQLCVFSRLKWHWFHWFQITSLRSKLDGVTAWKSKITKIVDQVKFVLVECMHQTNLQSLSSNIIHWYRQRKIVNRRRVNWPPLASWFNNFGCVWRTKRE